LFGSPDEVGLRAVEAVAFESLRQRVLPVAEAFKSAVAEALEAATRNPKPGSHNPKPENPEPENPELYSPTSTTGTVSQSIVLTAVEMSMNGKSVSH
jgi:hypothetical protein